MRRQVRVHLEADVGQPALVALQIAVAAHTQEHWATTSNGQSVSLREVAGPHGGRIHLLDAPPGHLVIDYTADVDGPLPVAPTSDHDLLLYRRPSRYCPSDRFTATAAAEFGGIADTHDYVQAVVDWVGRRLIYIAGSSGPTDDAVDSLLLGEGVCRDYAHVVTSLLRAHDIPARVVAVYAPGLDPMDFHAVVEAWVDGAWLVVDATRLTTRGSMLRIATGRDAADTAFMSVHHGTLELVGISVLAVADELPVEDRRDNLVLS